MYIYLFFVKGVDLLSYLIFSNCCAKFILGHLFDILMNLLLYSYANAFLQLGGFGLPFFVVGSITIVNGLVGYFLLGEINGE